MLLQDSENLVSQDFQQVKSEDLDFSKIDELCRLSAYELEKPIDSEQLADNNGSGLQELRQVGFIFSSN